MKYIVVYTIAILGLTSLNAPAQKPSIDLLPTTSSSVHPEAMIDTSITHDSLHGSTAQLKYLELASPTLHQKNIGTGTGTGEITSIGMGTRTDIGTGIGIGTGIRLGLYSLIFKRINPIMFIFYFTALKF